MADENKVKRLIVSGKLKGEDGITPHIGENGNWFFGEIDSGIPARGLINRTIDCDGNDYELQVESNTVYRICNCTIIAITFPDDATDPLSAHLFIQFVDDGVVGINFPEGCKTFGDDPSTASPGEEWEISVDSAGIICLGKKVFNE